MKTVITLITGFILASCLVNKEITTETEVLNLSSGNTQIFLQLEFVKGFKYNYSSFVVWIEDLDGKYIEILFVTQFVATGKFNYSEIGPGKWKNEPGFVRRPASLPYWAHKRNIQAPDGLYIPSPETPVADAITGATPKGNFTMNTGTTLGENQKFRIMMEINQAWDSNKFWTNDKYPGDNQYFASLQPALVYSATVDPLSATREYVLNPIGHSHPAGKTGELFTDMTTLTTAKQITFKITVRLK